MKKPWAGRFSRKTVRKVEDFTESISFDHRLWPHDVRGSIAHARMLGKQKIITRAEARKIIGALEAIARQMERGKFQYDPALEDIHMNIEAALVRKVGAVGGKLHSARSRNDQIALDMRLYLRLETEDCMALIAKLQRAVIRVAEKHADTVMPGYTHLQRAQPVTLGHHMLAYAEMLERDKQRFVDALKRINVLPLGSAALAGTSLPIDRKAVARELGFKAVSQNSMDAVSDRDFLIEFCSAASALMMHLSRISEELVLWSSEEFSFLKLPDEYATGSSIMPQKKNPDVPELVRGKTGRVYGNLLALLTAMKGLPLAYNRDLQEDKPPVFDTVDTVKECLGVLSEMLPKLKFDKKRMRGAAGGGFAVATDLAEYLVGKGVPFRDAHEIVGKLVAHCEAKAVGLEALGLKGLRKFSRKFGQDVLKRLDVDSSVRSRSSEGGTAPSQVKRQIRRLKRLSER